jgi:hypothetical protein
MDTHHIAAALLAGPFHWNDNSNPNLLRRAPEGTPFVEFNVLTTELRGHYRVETAHGAVAYGPLAIRIATTFTSDDFVAVSGELCTAPGYHRPTTLLNVKNALRSPGTPLVGGEPTLNVACVIGPVLDATATRLRDGTSITVLTVVCQSPRPNQYRNLQTVVLTGAQRNLVQTIGSGDTIRADGQLALHAIGREAVWGLAGAHLRVLERCRDHVPLVLRSIDRSFQRTG